MRIDRTDDDQLPTQLWIDAQLHVFTKKGGFYTVINKGAYARGTVMLKLFAPMRGAMVLQQQRDMNGVMGWMALFSGQIVAEAKADEYIKKATDRDPDLWVIEIEDKELKNPFEGKIF